MSARSRTWLAAAVAMWLLCAAPVRAEDIAPYRDDRDSNYLKVLYHFVYPVGKAAEMFFFRPLHAFTGVTQPDPDRRYEDTDIGSCLTFRPQRKCSRAAG